MSPRVVVVGGGISGLACAYFLTRKDPSASVSLLEPGPLGGVVRTERTGGFVIESGPDSFISQKPAGLQLCKELGLEDELVATLPGRATYIVRRGRLVELPEGLMLMAPTRLLPFAFSPLLSWPGKLRAALDMVLPARPADGDESLASFIERRFGRELFARVAEPLVSGIYSGDARQLSLLSTFPQFAELERRHGSVIRGLRARPPAKESRYTLFMSLRDGMGRLVEALASRLPPGTVVAEAAAGVGKDGRGFTVLLSGGRRLPADAVVLAAPAYASAELLKEWPEAAALLSGIEYASIATVSLGYAGVPAPRGYGFVAPKVEGRRLLACTWTSSKYPRRAPEGHILLRGYVAGEDARTLNEAALVELARGELRELMDLDAEPVLTRVQRWPRAMPQYKVGHAAMVARLEKSLSPGLVLAGSAYRGGGLPDCIQSGARAAESALAYVKETA